MRSTRFVKVARTAKPDNFIKMVVKYVVVLALLAITSASDLSSFSYSVADPSTGDFKSQIESRLGNDVKGQYSLLESDGTQRTVDYAAGAQGFNAVVRKDPALIAAAPWISAPYAYSAPFGITNLGRLGALKYATPYPYASPFPYAPIY